MFLPWILNILIVSSTILKDNVVSGTATIVPHNSFNPDTDATEIYKAMKGFGTNEAKIISIATKRTNSQRLEIKEKYQKRYDTSILKAFAGEISGNFLNIMTAMFQNSQDYAATAIYNAVKGLGTVDDTLTDIFCCLPDGMMEKLIIAYNARFKRDLKKDVSDDTSGDYYRLLVALMKDKRADSKSFHSNRAKSLEISRKLVKAGLGIIYGTEETPIIEVFTESSYKELAEVADVYEKFTNISLEATIKAETSGNFRQLLLQILLYATNPVGYYADLLRATLYRSFFDVLMRNHSKADTLIRVLVTRSEVDLKEIATEYEKQTQMSLEDDVKKAFSGDFENTCLALIKGNA